MIDSHCHLADAVFSADLDLVVGRAKDAGVERVLVVLEAGNEQEAAQAVRVESLWPEARMAIGVHPHHAHAYAHRLDQVADLVRQQVSQTPSARAIGEIGLDYHYDFSPRPVQHAVFRAQVDLASALQLPVVIHTREADDDTLAILREAGNSSPRGVLHCFTGTAALARAALELGLYVSLAGIVTFNRANELRETARLVPLDRLLVETDSPFLAPIPHRGTRNEPALVAHVLSALARIHGVGVDELDRRTTANFHRLFRP